MLPKQHQTLPPLTAAGWPSLPSRRDEGLGSLEGLGLLPGERLLLAWSPPTSSHWRRSPLRDQFSTASVYCLSVRGSSISSPHPHPHYIPRAKRLPLPPNHFLHSLTWSILHSQPPVKLSQGVLPVCALCFEGTT